MKHKVKLSVSTGTVVKVVLAVTATRLLVEVGMGVSLPYIKRLSVILDHKMQVEKFTREHEE